MDSIRDITIDRMFVNLGAIFGECTSFALTDDRDQMARFAPINSISILVAIWFDT